MQPTYFINHGGGPCFFLEPSFLRSVFQELEKYLNGFAAALPERPQAVLIVSGHWEEDVPTVNAGASLSLFYDYDGFPPHTYRLTYPALGAPSLARRVRDLLDRAGIASNEEIVRGWDHGVFVPMKVMFPTADIPLVQLIVGSGQTYHNMGGFRSGSARDDEAERSTRGFASACLTGRRAIRR